MDANKQKALDLALGQIEKAFGKEAICKLGDSSIKKVEAIPTGALSLDLALGVGGLPRGRVIEIYGPEAGGKTTLSLHVAAQTQKMGGTVAFIDAEHALDPAEKEGMRRSRRAMESADLILFVLDASRPLTPEEQELWQAVRRQPKRTIIVWNKTDLKAAHPVLDEAEKYEQAEVSCKTGEGVDNLKKLITADVTEAQTADGLMISNLRHYEALLRAQTELESALIRLQTQAGGEIYAEHLRGALTHLQDLIGEVTPDDVLGIIFSKFCMGK